MTDTTIRPHLGLSVRNLDASVAFYSRLFDLEPSKVRPHYAKFELRAPALNLTLNELPELSQQLGPATHFGIELSSSDAVAAAMARSRASGLEVEAEMDQSCCYARQDKFWATDPDGHRWEHFVVTDADTAEHGRTPSGDQVGGQEPGKAPCCEPTCCGDSGAAQ